jgi:hypothetical protein
MKRFLEGYYKSATLIWYVVSIALIVYNLMLGIKTNLTAGIILLSVMLGIVVLVLVPIEILRRIKEREHE